MWGYGCPHVPTSSSNDSHSFGYSRCTWSSTICKCREYLTGDIHRSSASGSLFF